MRVFPVHSLSSNHVRCSNVLLVTSESLNLNQYYTVIRTNSPHTHILVLTHLVVSAGSTSLHAGFYAPTGQEVPPPSLGAGGDLLNITKRPTRQAVGTMNRRHVFIYIHCDHSYSLPPQKSNHWCFIEQLGILRYSIVIHWPAVQRNTVYHYLTLHTRPNLPRSLTGRNSHMHRIQSSGRQSIVKSLSQSAIEQTTIVRVVNSTY